LTVITERSFVLKVSRIAEVVSVALQFCLPPFARLRSLNGPQNMAVVKHMAMNLVRNPKDKHSLKVRRKLANLNPDYLETLIRQTDTLT
jgi:hypothetical protein